VPIACPAPYLPGRDQIFRNAARNRTDLEELRLRAKPKTRAELKALGDPLAAE
jgi:anthraniloyl-CoA monooxygenase